MCTTRFNIIDLTFCCRMYIVSHDTHNKVRLFPCTVLTDCFFFCNGEVTRLLHGTNRILKDSSGLGQSSNG